MAQKKSHEQFIIDVFTLVKNEYEVLGTYTYSNVKIKMRHNNQSCKNYEFEMKPNKFLSGQRCPKCGGTTKKDTEQYRQEVFELVGNEYEVFGIYKNNKSKLRMKHTACGYEWDIRPNEFLSGSRCPKCNGGVKNKTTEYYKHEVYELVRNEYEVLGEYRTLSKIKMKHNMCGYIWDVLPSSFLSGRRCPLCSGVLKKDTDQFKQRVFELVGNEYGVLDVYNSAHDKVRMVHNVCNHVFISSYNVFITKGSRCPKCANRISKTTEEFKQEVFNMVGDEYEVLGTYINAMTKIRMKHNVCGCEFKPTPNNFIGGTRCPSCKVSKGEKIILNFLINNKIEFKSQYKFDDCKNQKPLPFDFAIVENNMLIMLIEYDGQQHYKPHYMLKNSDEGIKQLAKTKKNDKIKTEYCIKNNIPLIRIPYWEIDNIETIPNERINKIVRRNELRLYYKK